MFSIEWKFDQLRVASKKLIEDNKFEKALRLIAWQARLMYLYNQWYVDADLENQIDNIAKCTLNHFDSCSISEKSIIFYDGFGYDLRDLAGIYLTALVKLNYKVTYLTYCSKKGRLPSIEKIFKGTNCCIKYLDDSSVLSKTKNLYRVIESNSSKILFFYSTPWDIAGIMAFSYLPKIFTRYMINLTDHAFWLGRKTFDRCIEFRDYGAMISINKRNIPREKLVKQPYYPIVDKECNFEGYPFEKNDHDFLIFSGGDIYKTIDDNRTFYKIVQSCLDRYLNVKFWYAGRKSCKDLDDLIKKYPNRVFYSKERKDLFQVLQNVDMYLNTYPIGGGLMTQYAALAKKTPWMLMSNDEFQGILLEQDKRKFTFYDEKKFYNAIYSYIDDVNFRRKMDEGMANAVIDEEDFVQNLSNILRNGKSSYAISDIEIHPDKYLSIYKKQFNEYEIEKNLIKKDKRWLIRYAPAFYIHGVICKLLGKF